MLYYLMAGVLAIGTLTMLNYFRRIKKKNMNQLLKNISQLGSLYDLNFTSQEVLKDYVLGLDGMHRKLLVLERKQDLPGKHMMVDLADVQHCRVRKEYGKIMGGELSRKKLSRYLEEVALCLELNDGAQTLIRFYKRGYDDPGHAQMLEKKAAGWESVLSKLVNRKKVA